MTNRLRSLSLLALFLPAAALAVENWTAKPTFTQPPGRYGFGVAYDAFRHQTVVFGGETGINDSTGVGDTWIWDGSTWTQINPATSPSARGETAMVYDPDTHQIILFGGTTNSNTKLADTWAWDGSTWTKLSPFTSPPARDYHAMVYDEARHQVVLYGGIGTASILNDTWIWDGSNWSPASPAASPSRRQYPTMAYDAARQRVVLWGGLDGATGLLGDTWLWDGTTWSQAAPATLPTPTALPALAYDPASQQVIMFSGISATGFHAETWAWNGTDWKLLSPATAPPGRAEGGMVFDSDRQQLVMFGGASTTYLNDTWTFGINQLPLTVTVPAGVQFTFNNVTYTGTQSIQIAPGTYTLSTTTPQAIAAGTQAVFESWDDGGAISHTVTIGASPVHVTGNFTTQYLLTLTASPGNGGTLNATSATSNGPYFDAGSFVSVFQQASVTYNFTNWSGVCSGASAFCAFTINAPASVTANFAHPTFLLTINVPAGIHYTLGGVPEVGPISIALPAFTYTLGLVAPQLVATGVQTAFVSWSDHGAATHDIVLTAPLTVTGAFKTQYLLTTAATPAGQGSIGAGGSWFDAGSAALVLSFPGPGYELSYWTGDCTGSRTTCAVTMNSPKSVTGHFAVPQVMNLQQDTDGPQPPRVAAAMAYDAHRGETVLFGGISQTDGAFLNDTWIWNGQVWRLQNPPFAPDPRNLHSMAYHAGTKTVVLFGGSGVTETPGVPNNLGDTWSWNGDLKTWTLHRFAELANDADHRIGASLVEYGSNILLFGGLTGSVLSGGVVANGTLHDDLWRFDGDTWTQLHPNHSPPARFAAYMTYDPIHGQVVLAGGVTPLLGTNQKFFDTWVFDGVDWSHKSPSTPIGETPSSAAFDPSIQQSVFFGYFYAWTWDGSTWTQRSAFPVPLSVYDSAHQHIFGLDVGGDSFFRVAPKVSLTLDGVPNIIKRADGTYALSVSIKNQGTIQEVLHIDTATLSGAIANIGFDTQAHPLAPGVTDAFVANFPAAAGNSTRVLTIGGTYSYMYPAVLARWSFSLVVKFP